VRFAVADALLETKVKVRLLEQLGKVAFDIEVEATDGVVSLSGTVPDAARRDLAGKIAKGTGGVKELHDLLKVGQ
jgi:hyperosmotically inducible protein